jgi:hypothetical protein
VTSIYSIPSSQLEGRTQVEEKNANAKERETATTRGSGYG